MKVKVKATVWACGTDWDMICEEHNARTNCTDWEMAYEAALGHIWFHHTRESNEKARD